MRPINKWNPQTEKSIREEYNPYTEAKSDLVRNIGTYCSYCEQRVVVDSLHVEHVQYKNKYTHLKNKWSNFLLSCPRCNGTDNKGTKDVDLATIDLPHLNNTFRSIYYLEGGVVVVNPSLQGDDQIRAQQLIDLVGLDKCPGHPEHKHKDARWSERRNVWECATRLCKEYQQNRITSNAILTVAQGWGFWSVWMTVFQDYPEVTQVLVDNFPGTATQYFNQE